MAASGYTPISLYYSTTASAVPSSGNLVNGELALNTADMKLYTKNSSGTVTLLASSAGSSGDVVGPASATDSALVAFDGTTGKLVKQAATVTAAQGGTGQTSAFTQWGVTYAATTGALATTAAGTAGYVLTSNGTSAPTFQPSGGISTGKSIAMAMIFGF